MAKPLDGKRVAILVADGFEQIEMTEPRKALEDAGATTAIVSPSKRVVKAWSRSDWGEEFPVEVGLEEADAESFDALLLPGGVMNPDKLRIEPRALDFVRAFFEGEKPVAAICHAPWTLIDAGVLDGRDVTSWESLRADLENAGASWFDRPVVVDFGLVTSRSPDDLPAFHKKMIEEFAAPASPDEPIFYDSRSAESRDR
jgi:protease I